MRAIVTERGGAEHVFEAEGFLVTTTDVYSAKDGKRCAGFQAYWDGNAAVWYVYQLGRSVSGLRFDDDAGVEVSVARRRPFYQGKTQVGVYGAGGPDKEALTILIYALGAGRAYSDHRGWLEDKAEGRKRGSLKLASLGSYEAKRSRPCRRTPLFREPVSPSLRTRLSSLAERRAA